MADDNFVSYDSLIGTSPAKDEGFVSYDSLAAPSGGGFGIPNLVSDVAEAGARGIDWAAQQFGAEPRQPQPFSFQRPEVAKEEKYFGVIPAVKSAVESAKLPGEVYEGKVDPLSDEGIRRAAEFAMTFSPVSPGTLAAGRVLPQAALQTGEHGAMSRFEKALVSDKDTREAMLERLTQARETRPQATIADVGGENIQGLLEDLAQTPGAGRTTVIPRMEARQKYQMARISNDLASITGDNRSAFRAIEQTLEAQKSAATPLYKQAFADGDRAVWNPELERLSSAPVVQDAMRSAVTGWRNQAIADGYGAMNPSGMVERGGILMPGGPKHGASTAAPPSALERLEAEMNRQPLPTAPAGYVPEFSAGQLPAFPNIQFWDYTKKALDIQQAAFIKAHGKPSAMLTSVTQQLRKSLDEEVPSYAAARRSYAGHAAFLDAIEEGRAILSKKTTAEEFRVFWEGLSESEKEGVRIGAISDIRNRMGQNAAKLPNQTRFVQAPEVRAKLNIMMPSEEVGKRFNQALDYEIGSSELVNRSLRGPATARRLAERQEAERELSAEDALALYSLTHGHALPFAHSLWRRYGKPIQNRMRRNQDAFLAELLTATQPSPAVTRALSARRLQRATPPSPNLMQGIVTGVGAGIGGMKSGGPVKPFNPASWREVKLPSRDGRLQAGGVADPVLSQQAGQPVDSAGNPVEVQAPAPTPAPLDPSLNVLSGMSASGAELNPQGVGGAFVPGQSTMSAAEAASNPGTELWQPYNNQDVLNLIRQDPLHEGKVFSAASGLRDPRVEAFWANPENSGLEPVAGMLKLMEEIPDAGRGTLLGGIGTFADIYAKGGRPPSAPTYSHWPSTNNWTLLPPEWQTPGYYMRNGAIIDIAKTGREFWPGAPSPMSGATNQQYGGSILGLGPVSYSSWQMPLGEFWPGAVYGGYWNWGGTNASYQKSGGPVPFNPASWREVKLPSRDGRMQEGGEVPPPEDTAPPPLQGVDPRIQQAWDTGLLSSLGFTQSQGILSGPADYWTPGSSQPEAAVSSGISIDATGAPTQAGPTPLLQSMLTNSLAQADAFGQSAPSDPRVDAFYQANPGATLDDMWKAIPNAGVGSPLGGVGTLHNQEIRDYFNDMRGGAAGDPGAASILAQSPFYAGQDAASTNNWQLLPPMYRQPGMIARNGVVINPATWASDRGFAAGMNPQGGPSAEQGNIVPFIGFGTGTRFGYPGLYGPGYAPASVGWPGSMTPWFPLESGAMGGGAKRGGRVGGLLG